MTVKQKTSYSTETDKEILRELISKDKEILQLETSVEQLEKKLELQKIQSPVDGVVQGLGANTIGGVVISAKPLVTIVPENIPLIIEASVLNKDIGFISVGQKVDIKFDTFSFQKYGTVEGEIVHISPDAVENKNLGYVYKINVRPSTDKIQVENKKVSIVSGMTVIAEVKTGKRRIIEFFLPAIEHIKENFKLR